MSFLQIKSRFLLNNEQKMAFLDVRDALRTSYTEGSLLSIIAL
jgi:hypothetical protein